MTTERQGDKRARAFDKHAALKRVSDGVLAFAGQPEVFFAVCGFIVIWAICGFYFGFDTYWYGLIQTVATIVTLLMVFIIQDSQNRDTATLHLKLDELIRANASANNELLDLEHLTLDQLEKIQSRYKELAASAPATRRDAERAIDDALTNASTTSR